MNRIRAIWGRNEVRHHVGLAAWRMACLAVLALAGMPAGAVVLTMTDSAITIEQIDFRGGLNSGTGEFTVDLSAARTAAVTGGDCISVSTCSGFINATDSGGNWIVRNLPVESLFSVDNLSLTTRIDLGTADGVVRTGGSMSLHVEFNTAPTQVFASGPASLFSLSSTNSNISIGGVGDSLVTGYLNKPNPNAIIFGGGLVTPENTFSDFQKGHNNVEAALNQCAPAAVANSLDWLRGSQGLPVPDPNNLGLKGDNTLVGKLDTAMDRIVTGPSMGGCDGAVPEAMGATARQLGCGVWPLDGKLKYIADNHLGLEVNHQGDPANQTFTGGPRAAGPNPDDVVLDGNANVTRNGVTSNGRGRTVTWDFIDSEIKRGEDVELDIWFQRAGALSVKADKGTNMVTVQNANGVCPDQASPIILDAGTANEETRRATNVVNNGDGTCTVTLDANLANDHAANSSSDFFAGRHYVNVVGAGKILGVPYIQHISDHDQTDTDPTDTKGTKKVDFAFLTPGGMLIDLLDPNWNGMIDQVITESIPEPGSLWLLGFGLLGLARFGRTRIAR